MIAQHVVYGTRINGDHMRYCSICGKQRATERGKFVAHQMPSGKPCGNSGVAVKKANEQAAG